MAGHLQAADRAEGLAGVAVGRAAALDPAVSAAAVVEGLGA